MPDGLGASLNGILTSGNSSVIGGTTGYASSYQEAIDQIYKVQCDNWYKSKPYGFVFFDRAVNGTQSFAGVSGRITFWLPINPENINVTTHFATNIITTLYGIVEEHSEVRYYDIVISGTTGYGPRYFSHVETDAGGAVNNGAFKSSGREAFQAGFLESISLPGGIGAGALGAASQIANSVTDAVSATQDGANTTTGIDMRQSGYVAFHNFYRFLLQYKKDGAGLGPAGFAPRTVHPLQFLNYKDRIKYDCVPISFTLTRSAESPMLYNYNIKMRAFNLRNVSADPAGVGTEAAFLASLGLSSSFTDEFNDALGAVGGAVGAIGSLF